MGGQTSGRARDLSRCTVRRGDRAALRVQGGQRLSLAAGEGRPSLRGVRLSVKPLPPQPSHHWPGGAFHAGAGGLSDRLAPPSHCPAAAVEAACCLCQSLGPRDHHSDALPGTPRGVRYSGRGRGPPECSAVWEGLGQPAVKGQRLSIPVTLLPALRPWPRPLLSAPDPACLGGEACSVVPGPRAQASCPSRRLQGQGVVGASRAGLPPGHPPSPALFPLLRPLWASVPPQPFVFSSQLKLVFRCPA